MLETDFCDERILFLSTTTQPFPSVLLSSQTPSMGSTHNILSKAPEEWPKETPQDIPKETVQETAQETPKETTTEKPKRSSRRASKDTPRDKSKDTTGNSKDSSNSKPKSPPPKPEDDPRPQTPSSHWGDPCRWPSRKANLPFTIPLSAIDQLSGLNNPKIREVCTPEKRHFPRCIMCTMNANARFQCMSCGEAWYCSTDCQTKDLPTHQLLCDSFAPNNLTFADVLRPSPQHVRAMVWPARSDKPELRWVHVHYSSSDKTKEPSLSLHDPEFLSFARNIAKPALGSGTPLFRMGCLNLARAFEFRPPLGSALFILEWAIPPGTDLSPKWVNRSVAALGLPGQIWYHPGPLLVLALDLSRSPNPFPHSNPSHPPLSFSSHSDLSPFPLKDITPRDLRHTIDYLQLSTRNPVLTDPLRRYPFPLRCLALKLTPTTHPMAAAVGIAPSSSPLRPNPQPPSSTQNHGFIEEVSIATATPTSGSVPGYEGLSVLCAKLGLNWVFRDAICHGPEFDWLYDPDLTVEKGGKGKGKGGTITAVWRRIFTAPPEGGHAQRGKLLNSGDGIVVVHRTGRVIYPEHLWALMEYVGWRTDVMITRGEKEARGRDVKAKMRAGREGFERFWGEWMRGMGLERREGFPSPWDLEEKYARRQVRVGRGIVVGEGKEKVKGSSAAKDKGSASATSAARAKESSSEGASSSKDKGSSEASTQARENSNSSQRDYAKAGSSSPAPTVASLSGSSSSVPPQLNPPFIVYF